MSDETRARRAALMAELAALPTDDDDDDDGTADALDHAIDELGHAAQAAADNPPPAPVVIEAPAVPDPADAVRAEAAVVKAEGDREVALIEAQTDAEIRLMHERHELGKDDREHAHEIDATPLTDVLDEVLGPIDEAIEPDSTPAPIHRWFRPMMRGRR